MLRVWDLETGRALRTLEGHADSVRGVAVTADGRRAASASGDHTLKVWDLASGMVLATFTCDAPLLCCTFASAHKILVGDAGGRLHFLLIEEGTPGDARTAAL
jgi:WD40 repeat protein